jgi:carbonic anhydrase
MDPRVNLAAAGVLPFRLTGEIQSQTRVIRTLGGIADKRSLVVGIHLAGLKEIAVIMHTDCGCSLAYSKIDTIIENMQANLSPDRWEKFTETIGEPLREKLREWLQAFQEPNEAVKKEVEAIKGYPFVPESLIVHGLVYDLATGKIQIVVNGYDF